ncbi:formylglycine-generating enzyme family protein [Verrucomicrobiales bacterium]|nr:formylglycine-generating enzyme family protein [Verrucomicrobiales bacterium]
MAATWTNQGKIEEAKRALAEAERLAMMEKDAGLATRAGETLASGPAIRKGSDFAGRNPGEEIRNGKGLKLCWIPAGSFTMGSPESEPEREADKEAQVEVELTDGFWLGKYEVTKDEYESLIGTNPARFEAAGEDAPVEQVNWDEAMAFCEKLTALEHESGKLPKEWTYSLPTEAQWEYACRAGEPGPYSGGNLQEVTWFQENSDGKTHEVGKKKANAWGLHDMHGNVREWCLDWSTDQLAGDQNPTGPDSGTSQIILGGLYYNEPNYHRAARRGSTSPNTRVHGLGFRICIIFSK